MDAESEKHRRLSLTKKQVHEENGAALLALLSDILSDGKLSDSEIGRLRDWLGLHHDLQFPGIAFLSEVIEGILSQGSISETQRLDIQLCIEKVLPLTERSIAREARESVVGEGLPPSKEHEPRISRNDLKDMRVPAHDFRTPPKLQTWRGDPMTEPQRHFIKSLGSSISNSATKGEASDLIESLLGNKPISSRQLMVMRFWGRQRIAGEGPREISEWLDEFYSQDPCRKLAWELFKNESEDNGLQGDPERVPLGAGPEYLARLKQGGGAAVARFRASGSGPSNVQSGRIINQEVPVRQKASWKTPIFVGVSILSIAAFGFYSVSRKAAIRAQAAAEAMRLKETPAPLHPAAAEAQQPVNRESDQEARREAALREIKAAVMGLDLRGIIGGKEPRVMIGSDLYRTGEIVDRRRGILIKEIDAKKRTVIFSNASGDTVGRALK